MRAANFGFMFVFVLHCADRRAGAIALQPNTGEGETAMGRRSKVISGNI
jgi:hypothetical protein